MFNWSLIIKTILIVVFVVIGIDVFIKGKVIKKIGKKSSIELMILIAISFIGIFYIKPMVATKMAIKKDIKNSELNQYTVDYNLSGYKNSTVNIEGDDSFLKLDDKTKYEYMREVEQITCDR